MGWRLIVRMIDLYEYLQISSDKIKCQKNALMFLISSSYSYSERVFEGETKQKHGKSTTVDRKWMFHRVCVVWCVVVDGVVAWQENGSRTEHDTYILFRHSIWIIYYISLIFFLLLVIICMFSVVCDSHYNKFVA